MVKKKEEPQNNGQDMKELLQTIAQNQQELSDRLNDLEETAHKSNEGSTLIKLANMYFNTDDQHIQELSFISPLASEPFAAALALDEATSEEMRSGAVSLNRRYIMHFLRLQRSVHGRLLGIGTAAMEGQVTNEGNKDENMPEFEAGKE